MMKKLDDLMKLAEILEGLTVLGCRPSSPAARAGVRYGDIVLSVNGSPTPNWRSFIRARELAKETIEIVVFRDGDAHEISIDLRGAAEPVSPGALLAELIEQRGLASAGSDDDDSKPS